MGELNTHLLGMEPYTLIVLRKASDGSGDPALHVEAGGGAEEDPGMMPLLVVTERSAEESQVAEMLRELWADESLRPGVEAVTREFNEDWLPFVRTEAGAGVDRSTGSAIISRPTFTGATSTSA